MRLRELRMARGISQKKLADHLGMSPGNLCDWEKGRSEPNIASLIRLANYFGESIDNIVGRVDKKASRKVEPLSSTKQHLIHLIHTMSDADIKVLTEAAEAMLRTDA